MKRDSKAAQREKRFDVKLERVRKFEKERERETPEEQWKDIVASRCVGASEWNDGSLP